MYEYVWNGTRVTAEEFAALIADLFAQGWTLAKPDNDDSEVER